MSKISYMDLHMHSVISDGSDTLPELLQKVREEGIELFSLTDHDAIRGSVEMRALMEAGGEKDALPLFIPGVEFSCKDEEGKYHILGYAYDPDATAIKEVVAKGHGYRMKKVRARLDYIKKTFGFVFPDEEIEKLMSLNNPGKPHIANLMVKFGYAGSKKEGIDNYLNKIHFKSEYVRPEEAIAGILDAGGIPVLAHPAYGSGDELILGDDMETRLKRLIDFGIRGIEAYYSGFTEKISAQMLALAEKYVLYVTAGSDYHGTNKIVKLGDTGLGNVSDGPEGMQRFLADAIATTRQRQGETVENEI